MTISSIPQKFACAEAAEAESCMRTALVVTDVSFSPECVGGARGAESRGAVLDLAERPLFDVAVRRGASTLIVSAHCTWSCL